MLRAYRPVGNSITLSLSEFNGDGLSPFKLKLYQSGTAALSASILACIEMSNLSSRAAEIIIPAYACPDIASAILYAGAKPVMVDLEPDSPHLSIPQVRENITDNTAAIIAVNFLGIPEQVTQLRQVCDDHRLFLIVDSAQWFPKSQDTGSWAGDFNIISFGRGKPINLLSGGGSLTKNSDYYMKLPDIKIEKFSFIKESFSMVKIILFNIAIRPYFYGILARFPGLKIGETVFRPLTEISTMAPLQRRLIGSNIRKYKNQSSCALEIHRKLRAINNQCLVDLVQDKATEENIGLIRYPLLIKNRTIRDKFFRLTRDLGVSIFYPGPLNEISGLKEILDSQPFPHARDFSNHLITLPTHEDVDKKLLDNIFLRLENVLEDSRCI